MMDFEPANCNNNYETSSNNSGSPTSVGSGPSSEFPDSIRQQSEMMNDQEKESLATMAKSMTESLLEATDLLGGIPWYLVHEKHGISLFRAEVAPEVPCNVHAVCKLAADIEEVAESMITPTTDMYKKMMSMLSTDFLDGAVIQNIVDPCEQNPYRYVGLKWAAFKSSSPFSKDRDFIILEYVDLIEDDHGQKVAFRIMESVDLPRNHVPFHESPKYTRDIVPLMGFMYHTTKKPNELRMTYTCNFDKNGDLPAWAANSAIQSHVEKCITGTLKFIEHFRAKQDAIVLAQHQVMPMSEQDHCHLCQRNFCVLRRRYNCLKCGEMICSSCSSLRTTQVPDVGERQLRVCTACVIEARRCGRNSGDKAMLKSGILRARNSIDAGSTRPGSAASSPHHGGGNSSGNEDEKSGYGSIKYDFERKRRSCDDVLEPVKFRLNDYKTFSTEVDALLMAKPGFPSRSFSDGLMSKKTTLFTGKRRGSPADLAISLEAFRQHRMEIQQRQQQEQQQQQLYQNASAPASINTAGSSSPCSSSSNITSPPAIAKPKSVLSSPETRHRSNQKPAPQATSTTSKAVEAEAMTKDFQPQENDIDDCILVDDEYDDDDDDDEDEEDLEDEDVDDADQQEDVPEQQEEEEDDQHYQKLQQQLQHQIQQTKLKRLKARPAPTEKEIYERLRKLGIASTTEQTKKALRDATHKSQGIIEATQYAVRQARKLSASRLVNSNAKAAALSIEAGKSKYSSSNNNNNNNRPDSPLRRVQSAFPAAGGSSSRSTSPVPLDDILMDLDAVPVFEIECPDSIPRA